MLTHYKAIKIAARHAKELDARCAPQWLKAGLMAYMFIRQDHRKPASWRQYTMIEKLTSMQH